MINFKDIKFIRFYDILSILLLSSWINFITSEEFDISPALLLKIGKYGFSLIWIISFVLLLSELRDSLNDVRRSKISEESVAYANSLKSKEGIINEYISYIAWAFGIFIIFNIISLSW